MVSEKGYAGMEWMSKVKRDLSLAGFDPHLTWNDRKVVHTGWIRLAGILYDAGISGVPDQKLAIKLDIDTRPPEGALCERSIITRTVTFLVQHYNLPSMMAGKLDVPETVVSIMQKILSDVETMVLVKKRVLSAGKKMVYVPSPNRFTGWKL
jgi:hypothetical protein